MERNLLKGDGLGVCGPYKWSFGSFLLGPYIGNTKMYTNKNERKHLYIHMLILNPQTLNYEFAYETPTTNLLNVDAEEPIT